VHYGRCYDDSRRVPLADFEQSLAQSDPLRIFLASEGDLPLGFVAASIAPAPEGPVGRIHFFVVRPDAESSVAPSLLDRALDWFDREHASRVRQQRLDPVSGVLRTEQDRHLIDLLHARGFASGPVAGNMEIETAQFRRTDKLRAQADSAAAAGIKIRLARAEDIPAVRALNRQEGLALWDYHLDAMLAASAVERLLVAEQRGAIVAYANFLAARWDTDLTEFGPLLVSTPLRSLGLGSVLTAKALECALAHGKQRVRLSTLRFDFYRALGFAVTVTWQEQMKKGN
jgi:GNAT superfamily N-acetyltransferase